MNIRPFSTMLLGLGFIKDYDTRAGGGRIVSFKMLRGNRFVDVQLFDDGDHRASHFLNGRMCTFPTTFKTPVEMVKAIEYELKRTDHPEPKLYGPPAAIWTCISCGQTSRIVDMLDDGETCPFCLLMQ